MEDKFSSFFNKIKKEVEHWQTKVEKERRKARDKEKFLRHLTHKQLLNTARRYGIKETMFLTEPYQRKDGGIGFKKIERNLPYERILSKLKNRLYKEQLKEVAKRYNLTKEYKKLIEVYEDDS